MIRARHALLLVPLLALAAANPADAAARVKHRPGKGKAAPASVAAAACDDFYADANAAWLRQHPAPASGSVSAFDAMRSRAREQERNLLEDLARGASDAAGRALATVWNEGLNEAAIEAAGATPLQPSFARIGAIRKSKDIAAAVADLHAAGLPVLFNFAADRDVADADLRIGYASQGGLGLPDPAYYTRTDAETRDVLGRYRAYIQTILQLSGTPADQIATQSGWVLSMEMQLAQASLPLAQQREPASAYRLSRVADLQKAYPRLALAGFLKAQQVNVGSLSLANTRYFDTVEGMLANTPVEQWQAYLRFQVASKMAPYLTRAFQDAHFQMYEKLLGGAAQPRSRQDLVQDAIDRALGPLVGHVWTQRYLPAASREAATRVADGVRGALKAAIASNAWMDDATRAAAQAKLARLRIEIGEPASVPSIDGLALGKGFATDMLTLAAWKHRDEMAQIGQRGGARAWPQPAQIPNLSYDLLDNRLVVSAAMLQPPVFDATMSPAQQYGAFGALLGHALHAAIGGKGRSLDADGQLREWWSAAARAAFEQRTAPIVGQYDGYVVAGTTKVDGSRTREENLADLGGVELAWLAYAATDPAAGKPARSAADRAFFTAYAQMWARHSAADSAIAWAASSPQAPAKYRVEGVLANLAEFASTYACKPGQPMSARQAVSIWR
ncbi:MAG: M13 family metallopeptidase [Proteobacteria bacterium]|nr:M13 family metallopeptidase [Pseudomonadota bacterium]